MANPLLHDAALTKPRRRSDRLAERLFTWSFDGFVYNQIWEDPVVDLKAMQPVAGKRIVTIASAGCNVLNYLDADPAEILAVDLNPAHVALTRLKLTALKHLPDYEAFFRFFGEAKSPENVTLYDELLREHLDDETRAFWDQKGPLRRRRITMFSRGLYRRSLLGRTIATAHLGARLMGGRPNRILEALDRKDQIHLYERHLSRVFERRAVRKIAGMRAPYFGLGIPPSQFEELHSGEREPAAEIGDRVRRLACDFDLQHNYFAWQAFGRRYDTKHRLAVPPYLQADVYERIKSRADRVTMVHASLIPTIAERPQGSLDRFVFLDAQDWMTEEVINNLWLAVTQAAAPDAKVIFRTAGAASPLERKLAPATMDAWHYQPDVSVALHKQDRSAIYGGFHLYHRQAV